MNFNKKNRVTILGKALSSTIATMDSLGPIGHEVLKEFGILKLMKASLIPLKFEMLYIKQFLINTVV